MKATPASLHYVTAVTLSFGLCGNSTAQVVAAKHLLPDIYDAAKCNDGTQGGYYLYRATKLDGTWADKWIIHFKGGSTCNDAQSCADRRLNETEKTTSADAEHPIYDNFTNFGVFKVLRGAFPDAPFNEVRTIYCSSDGYTGNNMQNVGGNPWYIRGRAIAMAVVQDLVTRFGMNTASQVIISGSSAGASSVKTNAIPILEYLKNNTTMLAGLATWDGNWRVEYRPYAKDANSPKWNQEVAIARATFEWFGTEVDQGCIDEHGSVSDDDPDICYPLAPVFKQNKLLSKVSTFVSARSEDSVSTPAYASDDFLGYETAWASEMLQNVDGHPDDSILEITEEGLTAFGLPEFEAKKIVKEIAKGKMLRHGFHGMDDTVHVPYENIQMTTLGVKQGGKFITIEDAFLEWIRQTPVNLEDRKRMVNSREFRVMDKGLLNLVP